MKYIKTFEAHINANNYEEKDEPDYNYGDDEAFQKEMRLKEWRRKYRVTTSEPGKDDVSHTMSLPIIRPTDIPLDVYLKGKYKDDPNLFPDTNIEEDKDKIKQYPTLSSFIRNELPYYKWIVANKKERLLNKFYKEEFYKPSYLDIDEEEVRKELNLYNSLPDFEEYSPIYYEWLKRHKKDINFLPYKYFNNINGEFIKTYNNLKKDKSVVNPVKREVKKKKKIKKIEPYIFHRDIR